MMSFNDSLSMQIAHFDGANQSKSIPEKFKRKEFHSLAHEHQKVRPNQQSSLGFPGVDKEN